jgi:hypothetical protein
VTGLLASPRARLAAGLAALAAVALVAVLPGDLWPTAARAGLAAALLGAVAALARRRTAITPAPSRLLVVAQTALCCSRRGNQAGVALVEADGRRLVVAFGEGGAQLVADLGEQAREPAP